MPWPSWLFPPENILGPPLGRPTWIFLPLLCLSNSSTFPGIRAASFRYHAYCCRLIPATGRWLRQLSYQCVIFLDRPHATWLWTVSLPLSCSLCMGRRGIYWIHDIPGRRPVSSRKLARSSGSRTVTFECARTLVHLPSSCIKSTCGTVWGPLTPSVLPLCLRISWMSYRICLWSVTPLGCQPLPSPAHHMRQLMRKSAPLP